MITSKIYSTFILAIMSTIAFAQTEQPQDSVTGYRRTVPEIRQELHHSDRKIQSDNNLPEETLHSATGDSMTFRMPHIENIPSGWIIPQLGTSFNPFIWDYNRYNEFDLSGNSYLSTFSNHNTYLSIGTIIKAGAVYSFIPNDRWTFSGGIYVAQYTMPSLRIPTAPMAGSRFDAGINGNITYRLTDHLYLNVFGQYSLNGQRNSKMGYMVPDLYMQSHFGGTLDYMFNDKFGITGGAVHKFNPIKGHWETTPVFGPVIHLKKK
ncbi:hypothetical protein AE938_06720 [Bacteroides fragilis]|uniref:hypothetical protein n=2 Tax=Bacteroides fragilis TaxID=817 RepID=UPI001CA8D5EA|nr:hypothetical protein [Bacteroides fragilis]MBY2898565.1 hypothetical protein [Bacteroides fragilis]MCM0325574.1 hypothetical protein [Bacteroides fragilis]